MKRLFAISSLLLLLSLRLSAQGGYHAFKDVQGNFYAFEKGTLKQLETFNVPVRDFAAARNYIVYRNFNGQLKMLWNGSNRVLFDNPTDEYHITDYLMVFRSGTILYIWEKGKVNNMGGWTASVPYAYGDSLVGFYDFNKYLRVFYKGRNEIIEQLPAEKLTAGKNMLVYVNNVGNLCAYYHGKKLLIEEFAPQEWKTGRDVIAFVDNIWQFKIYYDENPVQAEPFTPQSYQTGDGMVAWVNKQGRFMLFDRGVITQIEGNPPNFYQLTDGILVYSMPGNYFKAYYDGQTYTLESYTPEKYTIDNDVLVYQDYMGKLKALYKGKQIFVSSRIVQEWSQNLDVVAAFVNTPRPEIFWEGTFY